MESSKQMKSDSSSEESDHHQEQVKDDSTGSTKRSYECTYCKRGFTNAQALGGHMNIHRKDRAKAKQHQHQHQHHANSSVSKAPNEDNMSSMSYFGPIWGEHGKCYVDPEAQRNCYMYPPPIFPSPSHPSQADCYGSDFSAPRSGIPTLSEEGAGANLSLQIGLTYEDGEGMRGDDQENDDVDLELRLGPDP